MIFRVTLKTPDALEMAIEDATDAVPGDDDREDLKVAAYKAAIRWFSHGEALTVELDTDRNTCVVVPAGR